MTHQESLISPTAILLLFYDVDAALDLALEGDFLDMDYEDKLQQVSQ